MEDYKEKLRLAKEALDSGSYDKDTIEYIFPELKESEDERIRKVFRGWIYTQPLSFFDNGISKEEMLAWLEKQSDFIKWQINGKDNKPKKNHSVLMQTTHGIAEGEWQGEQWHQYRWSSIVRDSDVLSWIELSELERQGEQKSADKVEPKFKVKYGGSEYNVLEVRDIAGVTFYGIEDEPNHIDYVLPENCEIVSDYGYGVKEKGSPYPTKLAMFSEQHPAWSEEDKAMVEDIIEAIDTQYEVTDYNEMVNWLKSLKERYTWKPSDEQMKALLKLEEMHVLEHEKNQENAHLYMVIKSLKEQLFKLKGE